VEDKERERGGGLDVSERQSNKDRMQERMVGREEQENERDQRR